MSRQFQQNHILALLPESTYAAWAPHFEIRDLPMGKVLYEPGTILGHVYFPTTAIVSWIYVLSNGACTEVIMTGRDGLVGMYQLMGGGKSHNRAMVQTAGQAVRVPLSVVLGSFTEDQQVQRLLLLYTQAMITQMAQIGVCHRHHTLDQQLCRMLLLTLDRMDGDTVVMTHELMSELLGVRREGVTLAAKRLMRDGVIHYARGRITVLDRAELENRACECYGVIHQEYERLLQHPAKVLRC
jgi:CRP-like cAMP-binding protein